jgi:hypothetical protein
VAHGSAAADRARGRRGDEPVRHRVCHRRRIIIIIIISSAARAAGARRTHLMRLRVVAIGARAASSRLAYYGCTFPGMDDRAYWQKKLREAEAELEAATRRSDVNAAAKRLQRAKTELKRLESAPWPGR